MPSIVPNAPPPVKSITSKSTRLEDLGTKRALYEMLGVKEYFLFDPLNEYISTQLQGFCLVDGYYQQPLPLSEDGSLLSEELGLILKPEQSLLRVLDAKTGESVPTLDEAVAQTETAVEQAKAAVQRAETAEARATRLEAELERLRRQLGQPPQAD